MTENGKYSHVEAQISSDAEEAEDIATDDEDDLPSESSPLLHDSKLVTKPRRPSTWAIIIWSASLVLCFLTLLFVLLFKCDSDPLAGRQSAIPLSDSAIRNSIAFEIPSDVEFEQDAPIVLKTSVPFGLDFDQALGVDGLGPGGIVDPKGGPLQRWRLSIGRFLSKAVSPLDVVVNHPITVEARSSNETVQLFNITLLDSMSVPIMPGLQHSNSRLSHPDDWLKGVDLRASITPVSGTDFDLEGLQSFFEHVWVAEKGVMDVSVIIPQVEVHIWNKSALHTHFQKNNITVQETLSIPNLSPWPKPGTPIDETYSEMLNLFNLAQLDVATHNSSDDKEQLDVDASASLPLPQLDILKALKSVVFPYEIPVDAVLPLKEEEGGGSLSLATVTTKPIEVSDDELSFGAKATTNLHWKTFKNTSDNLSTIKTALSRFLSDFLNNAPTPFKITGGAARKNTPSWLKQVLKNFEYNFDLPGVPPMPDIVRNVHMENLSVHRKSGFPWPNPFPGQPGGPGQVLVSGTLIADIALPDQLRSLPINVNSILPYLIIYNGAPPPLNSTQSESYPRNAFAIFHPDEAFDAFTEFANDPDNVDAPQVTRLYAEVRDAPIKLIEGRDSVFRSFMGKMLFGKAMAGVDGDATVNGGLKAIEDFDSIDIKDIRVNGEFKASG